MLRLALSFLLLFVLQASLAHAEDDHPRPFVDDAQAMVDIETGLAEALAENRRLLVVLGANWCHDSRALAHHFEDDTVSQLIEDHYVLRFVDVGWRDRNHAVMHRFGIAAIYATPTVLIIDPEREFLLNRHSTEFWTTAASRSSLEAVDYFTRWIDAESDTDGLLSASIVYQSMLTEIEVFEAEEGERLSLAYLDIGRWRTLEDDERPEDFDQLEAEVDIWRFRMVRQVRRLRGEAERQVSDALSAYADGAEITLDLIAGFDQTDPDLPLRIQPHVSERW